MTEPTICECYGGPLDGDVRLWNGDEVIYEIGPIVHVYEVCVAGHYHYEGAHLAPHSQKKEIEP